MKMRNIVSIILFIVFISLILFVTAQAENTGQEKELEKLSPKYRAFLAETQLIMHPKEKEVFLKLKTDEERDKFIDTFWRARSGRRRGIRNNIMLLRMLRLTQVLDLTEEQAAKIFPKINQIEKEKLELNGQIGERLRELRQMLMEEKRDEREISSQIDAIKQLRDQVKNKEKELETFMEDNLTLVQRAKYMIFSADFYRDLRDKVEKARLMRERSKGMPKKNED